jgi:hypothetical protein
MWRVDLSQIDDPTATFAWERLAKDNLTGVKGRRLIPSIWDPVQKRAFAVGGRNGIDGLQDVWALYPDVTGDACATLDPFVVPGVTPTATPDRPTSTPATPGTPGTPATATSQPPTAVPTTVDAQVCDALQNRVPQAAINAALSDPDRFGSFGQPANPGLPGGPFNPPRKLLSLRNAAVAYHPLFNPLVFKASCP